MAQHGGQGMVRLRRHNTGVPWGFRMHGGREYGHLIYVQQVTPNSIAHKAGLKPGDGILQISNTPSQHLSHEQAKMEIIRAGNQVDFIVERGAVDVGVKSPDQTDSAPRSQVIETPQYHQEENNPNAHQSQSRSFQLLQMSLTSSEPQEEPHQPHPNRVPHSRAVREAKRTGKPVPPALRNQASPKSSKEQELGWSPSITAITLAPNSDSEQYNPPSKPVASEPRKRTTITIKPAAAVQPEPTVVQPEPPAVQEEPSAAPEVSTAQEDGLPDPKEGFGITEY